MAILAQQKTALTGLNPAYANADVAGDSFANTGGQHVEFVNTNAAARNVTLVAQGACNHGVLHNVVVNIPAGNVTPQRRKIGPFTDTLRWNDVNGRVQMTYDAVTDLLVGVFAD
jgi:hypothetical protein